MGRRRGGWFATRPRNVEIVTINGVTYFRYVFPDGQRKVIGNSHDSATAFAKADALNGHFAQQQVDISQLVEPRPRKSIATSKNPTLATLITEFKRHDQARKNYTERTLEEQNYRLASYLKKWPDKAVRDFDTTDITAFLNKLTDNAYVKHRKLLWSLFQFAGHQGYVSVNPAAVTLIKHESKKVRQRHTWEGYLQILNFPGRPARGDKPAVEATPAWLQRAMRIGLYSLQRREDVVLLHKTENKVDMKARTITVLQRKTRNYKNPVWIEIEMGDELLAAVDECLRSDVPCPYLIHRRPDKLSKQDRDAKPHAFAVTPGYLSREFSRFRDASGAYAALKPGERPTFHELRALGTHLYGEAGYSDEYVMALSGHAKKRRLSDIRRTMPRRNLGASLPA